VPGSLKIATNGPITVLIADDERSRRHELGIILSLQGDLRVIGEAANGHETLRLATTLMPDVLLLDSTLPERAGVDVLQVLTGTLPRTRTIVVSPSAGGEHAIKLLQHGARGVVPKDSPMQLLLKSIRKVHGGELWIDQETVARLVDTLTSQSAAAPTELARSFGLTPREREIVGLVTEGEANKAIAMRLSIGIDTVKHHLTNIFDKTGTSNRLELALFALHHGLATNPRSAR
jgi:DNA-binding NarL/FixJ family response regulator